MASSALCSIDGCGKKARALGWCSMHHWRYKNHGDPLKLLAKPDIPKFCNIEGCCNTRSVGRKGMCNAHYLRWKRYGNPKIQKKPANGVVQKWLLSHVGYEGQECLIWPFSRQNDGRGAINHSFSPQAHRVMCMLAHGLPPSDRHEAAHSCGRGHAGCVNPTHLRWATAIENAADRWRHGTQTHGEQTWSAKLTIGDVREIRLLKGKMTQSQIGLRFGVDSETVGNIHRGETWRWFTCPLEVEKNG